MISKDVFTAVAAAVVALTSQSAWPQASAPGTGAPVATAAPVTREQRKAETAAATRRAR